MRMRRHRSLLFLCLSAAVLLTGCLSEADSYPASPQAYPTTSALAGRDDLPVAFDTTATTVDTADIYREGVWDSALLPNDFPSPTPAADVLWTQYTPAHGDTAEAWSLALSLTAEQWNMLIEAFRDVGWAGGGTDALASGDTLLDGAWINERYYAGVYRAGYDGQNGLYTVEITVSPRAETQLPETLSLWFPLFHDGYSRSGCRDDTDRDGMETWVFGGSGRFCGVSETATEAYRRTLLDSGFAMGEAPELPGLIGWAAEQNDGERLRRVEALYDPVCCTLELIYVLSPAA